MALYQGAQWSIFSYNFPSLIVVDSDTCTVEKIRFDCSFLAFVSAKFCVSPAQLLSIP